MRRLLIAVFVLCSIVAVAQETPKRSGAKSANNRARVFITISGRITDASSGAPLPGASVYLTEARIGAVANNEGVYTIRNVPAGHHLIEVSHTGYSTIVKHIDIAEGTELNFALVPAVVENQGVTVTGVTSATSTRNTPIPVTLVRKNELLQTPSTNIVDALSRKPGVSQVSTGPAVSKPVIRGLGYNRVVVVHDGMRQEGQQWGDEHGLEIDEFSVNRAEILKGPASIMYGSDALAGVVSLISNVPVTEGSIKANVYTSYQTNNGQVGLHSNVGGNLNGFSWNAYGSYKSAQDYQNKYDGRVFNSRFNERNFGGYVGLNKSWGFSHLVLSSFNQNVGLVEGDRDEATGQFLANTESSLERIATKQDLKSRELFTPKQNVQHYKIMSDNSFILGKSRLKVNFGYQENRRKEFGNAEDPQETELAFDLKTLDYNIQWRFLESNYWETTVGVNGMYQANRNKGEETIIPEYGLFDIGGFVFAQKMYKDVTLTGGLRYDLRSVDSELFMDDGDVKFAPFTRRFSNISGSAGVSYHPSDKVALKLNAARGYRAPTLSELASNGAHEGTNRYEYGQQDLKTEKSLQIDAGIDLDYQHISFSVSGFYNRVHDFIFYRRLSSVFGGDSLIIDGGEELEAFQYNQENATLYGLEAVVDLHPHPLDWLHFENTFSITRGLFDAPIDGSENLPLIPAPRLISEIRGNFNKVGRRLRNLYARIELDQTFEQDYPFLGYNTETPTLGYALLNIGAGVDMVRKDKTLFSLHLAAHNLTDEAYQNHLSRLKYAAVNNATGRMGVFNMGRNFSLKLNVPLSFTIK